MYIPQFVCGFIAGVVVAAVAMIAWAISYEKKNKDDGKKSQKIN